MAEDTSPHLTFPMPDLPGPIPVTESIRYIKSVQLPANDSTEPPVPMSTSECRAAPSLALTESESDSAGTSPAWPSQYLSFEDAMSITSYTSTVLGMESADHVHVGLVLPKTHGAGPTAQNHFSPFKGKFMSFDTHHKPMPTEALPDEPRTFHKFKGKNHMDLTIKWMSKYVHTQPLYQKYWSQQTDSTDGGVGIGMDVSRSLTELISTSLLSPPKRTPRHSAVSFWQEIPQVKESGLLERLGHNERLLQEALFEVLTSEASYLRSLSVVVNHFQKSYALAQTLHATDVQTLFSNLQEVKGVSQRFLLEMEETLEQDLFLSGIGDLVLKHCPSFHKVYVPYVANQMFQERRMQQLMLDNVKFVQVLQTLEQQAVCQRQSLKSFLVLPFQRITRLKILLESILKRSVPGSVLGQSVKRALKAVCQIVSECNERVGRMKHIEELVHLEKRVRFLKTKSFPLISQDRWLLRHGALAEIVWPETILGYKTQISSRPVYLHLFSDILLKSRTENDQFLVEDYAALGNVEAKPFNSKALGLPPAAFHLCLQQNNTGCTCSFVLVAASESEKQQWLTLLARPVALDTPPKGLVKQTQKEFAENLEEKSKNFLEQTVDPSLCVEAVAACEPNPSVLSRPLKAMASLRVQERECRVGVAKSWSRSLISERCSHQSGHQSEARPGEDDEPQQPGIWALKHL